VIDHAHALDRYEAGASPVHALDARVKVALTVLFALSCALLPDGSWAAFAASWVLVLALGIASGLGAGYAPRRSVVALPFALAGLSALVAVPGRPLAQFAVGPWDLVATDAGLVRFASILARGWLSVQMAALLAATTAWPDLLHALGHLRVPPPIVGTISFMARYLAVLADEADRLLRARDARSARRPGARAGGSVAWRARTAGHMAGHLFLRATERSERVYQAMLARGFRGQLLTQDAHRLRPADRVVGLAAVLVLGLIQVAARMGWPRP